MNKTELIAKVSEETGVSKKNTTDVINAVLSTVTDELSSGNKVQLVGFGTFETTKRSARQGVNPKTGEKMQIAESTVPRFKAGKKLKDAVM